MIGQTAMLASLNPAVQELGEQARDEQRMSKIEKNMSELKDRGAKILPEGEFGTAQDKAYTELMKEHQGLDLKRIKRGGPMHHYFKGASPLDKLAMTYPDLFSQKAENQRNKVEVIKKQKAAEAEAIKKARSKQIRDLIMNPNLEVK